MTAKRAYRGLLRELHPDRHPEWQPPQRHEAAIRLRAVQDAWEVVRHEIDSTVRTRGRPIRVPRGFCGFPRSMFYAHKATGDPRMMTMVADALFDAVALSALSGDLSGLDELGDGDLWRLDCYRQPVTDEQLPHLPRFTKLQMLDLADTRVTDAGLVHLSALRHLDDLNLCATAVTDEGLRHLSGLDELSVVNLRSTGVRGPGLEHLIHLPELVVLAVPGKVGREWRRRFEAERPEVNLT